MLALVLAAACSDGGAVATTTVLTAPSTTAVPTSTTLPSQDCGLIPYEVASLPERVDTEQPEVEDVPQDVFTTIPGTNSRMWFDADGEVALVFVRGSLPPVEWPGDRGEVSIDGARGVAGPLLDGSWMVAWYEGTGAPCDQFFMVFYPPVAPAEVEATIDSLDRTAG